MTNTKTIQRTDDYSLFNRIKGNRKPVPNHINHLIQAISKNPKSIEYTPIITNEKYEIIDGQHRVEALKSLKLPVYFIAVEGLALKDVQELNSITKPWTPTDFAKAYQELGNKNYDQYLDFKKTYGLNHDVLLSYLGLEKVIDGSEFKRGLLKVSEPMRSHDLCMCHKDSGEFYDGFKRRAFAFAFKVAWTHKDYNHKHMMNRLKLKGSQMQDYASQEDYLRELESIYNGNMRNGDRIRFF